MAGITQKVAVFGEITSEYVWVFQRLEACSCSTFTSTMSGWGNDFGVGCLAGFVTQAYLKNKCFNKDKNNIKNLAVGVCASAESGETHWNSPDSVRTTCALCAQGYSSPALLPCTFRGYAGGEIQVASA